MGEPKSVSLEAGLAMFRRRFGEVSDENVLLQARIQELEVELATLREEHSNPDA